MRDWEPEVIKAQIRIKRMTLASLGRSEGVSRQQMANALVRPHRKAEELIAGFLGVSPHSIWPSRYNEDGTRKRPQPRQNYTAAPRFRQTAEVRA
jgi:Ner family transcriptional regulator